jgi:hypothetical protein
MTSLRKIEANRRNALKSTGPITPGGKERSRCNAVRHGLTAETVIAVLESSADYQALRACRNLAGLNVVTQIFCYASARH